jgi:hypothetical protein
MNIITTIILALALSGCAQVVGLVPSFWDANQSHSIVNVAVGIDRIDCGLDQRAQARAIEQDLAWFRKYSETKGVRQQDVIKLIAPMELTLGDWITRASSEQGASRAYCEIKKTVLQQQSTRAAEAVQGRY